MMGARSKRLRGAVAAAALLGLSACATVDPGQVSEIARPDAAPTASTTSFEGALRCMDEQFADYGVKGVSIAVSGVPDYTGRAYVGSDIWLQTAITKMSQKSGAFVVTDFNPNPAAPEQSLWSMMADNQRFYVPAYYIRGAISGFAEGVASESGTLSVATPSYDGGAGGGRSASLVSVDLTVGDLAQRTLISRASAGNEMVLRSSSAGAQLGGRLAKFGASLEFSVTRSEGIPQAVRALVELGSIEILGRLAGTPYYTCLGAKHADPEAARARTDVHASMNAAERVVFAQRRLARLGYYAGPLNGQPSPTLEAAIAAYARDRGLAAAGGAESYALYERLSDWRGEASAPKPAATPAPVAAVAALPAPAKATAEPPLRIDVFLTGGGAPGAPVYAGVRAPRTAFTYCYLQDGKGVLSRVFPNRWQPDPLVKPNETVQVPSPQAGFQLVTPEPGAQERLACFASTRELGRAMPQQLLGQDLQPLPLGSLEDLRALMQAEAAKQAGELVMGVQVLGK